MSREQERSRFAERITAAEGKEKRYTNQMKILQREQAQLERKKRNRRIFTRGAMLESFLRKPLLLTDEQVYQLLKIAFNSPEVQSQETAYINEEIRGTPQETSHEKADSEYPVPGHRAQLYTVCPVQLRSAMRTFRLPPPL